MAFVLRLRICCLLICFVEAFVSCDRKITFQYNPQASTTTNPPDNLLYWRADGLNDTLHYLFSTIGYPTVLQIRTDSFAQLDVDWTALRRHSFSSQSIKFKNSSLSSFEAVGIGLSKLYLFNDHDDLANVSTASPSNSTVAISLANFSWNFPLIDNATDEVSVSVAEDSRFQLLDKNGTIKLMVDVFGSQGRFNLIPHLPHTENMGQLSLLLDRLFYNSTVYAQPRFALELLIVDAVLASNESIEIGEISSIDDEFTPGVFRTNTVKLPSSAFLAWKPVCYRDAERTLGSYTLITQNSLVKPSNSEFVDNFSILNAYFARDLTTKLLTTRAFNVTLGYPKDQFYSSLQYTLWTFAFGRGNIPVEAFSPLIITLIIVCFGLPGLSIIAGSIYAIVKRSKSSAADKQSLLVSEDPISTS